jgi:hypothetical protein
MLSGKKSFNAITPWLLGALLIGLCCGPAAHPMMAQVLYGSVVGTITDQSDSVVPNAAITLTNMETGISRDGTTDEGGRYSFGNVLPGRYSIKVAASGFRTVTQTAFEVTPNTVGRLDMKMEVGQLTETISVEATSAQLQTDKSDTHAEINTREVVGLPA